MLPPAAGSPRSAARWRSRVGCEPGRSAAPLVVAGGEVTGTGLTEPSSCRREVVPSEDAATRTAEGSLAEPWLRPGVRRTTLKRHPRGLLELVGQVVQQAQWPATTGSAANRAINPSAIHWASRSTSGSMVGTGWSSNILGVPRRSRPCPNQLLGDARPVDASRSTPSDCETREGSSNRRLRRPQVYSSA